MVINLGCRIIFPEPAIISEGPEADVQILRAGQRLWIIVVCPRSLTSLLIIISYSGSWEERPASGVEPGEATGEAPQLSGVVD
jgi:hypothetical protein